MKRKSIGRICLLPFAFKRTFSLHLNLDVIGSLALVGLKVTTPNMHRTANQFIQQTKDARSCCHGDLGLDQADQEELLGVKGARVEFGSPVI